jgi:aryl-alcohol dehydrogenase-like predicted oxidoreductase
MIDPFRGSAHLTRKQEDPHELRDPKTPIEETLRTLDDLVRSGKVSYVACVNYNAWQLADAAWTARSEHLSPFVSSQNRYNLIDRPRRCRSRPWRP